MTFNVVIGVDPGQTGAIAVVADGKFERFYDMPIMARSAGGHMVNANQLAAHFREILTAWPMSDIQAVLEQVGSMPKQGVVSVFRFGESYGMVQGVLGALSIPVRFVTPQRWKKHFGLIGTDKDCTRTLMIQRHPGAAAQLTRKKDSGRADALAMASWFYQTEQE